MDKKIFALAILFMLLIIPSASAVSPVLSIHRNFISGFGDWEQTPSNSWNITGLNYAETILNTSHTSSAIGFKNYTDLTTLNLTDMYEIDIEAIWKISSEYTITQNIPYRTVYIMVYEKYGSNDIEIGMIYHLDSWGYWVNGNKQYYIDGDRVSFYIKKNGATVETFAVDYGYNLYSNVNGNEYRPEIQSVFWQFINGDKTEIWFLNGAKSLEIGSFIPESISASVYVEYPNTLYNASRNFTFDLQAVNIDVYDEKIHQEIIPEETPKATDIFTVPDLIFIALLLTTFIISVAVPEKLPKNVGILALIFAIAIALYRTIDYYTANTIYAFIGSLLPIPIYLIKDKLPFRKGLFGR